VEFTPRQITLADARVVTIRALTPDDAEAFRAHGVHVQSTTPFVVSDPADAQSVEETRERIVSRLDRPGAIFLIAEPADQPALIVADCELAPLKPRKMRHVAGIGMGNHEDWRGVGLGTAMLRAVVDHATAHPALRRLELGVYADNTHARSLYQRLGFIEEGHRPARFEKHPGVFSDEVIMWRDVSSPIAR